MTQHTGADDDGGGTGTTGPGDGTTGPGDGAAGLGDGRLSAAAEARLARSPVAPLRPPDPTDRAAVARWRDRIHAAWLDGDPDPATRGHTVAVVAGVRCLVTGTQGNHGDAATPTAPGAADQGDRDEVGVTGDGGRPVIVYVHGGGYALGSPEVAVPITERLAVGADLVSVDYRLAPEHPHPAGRDDVAAVFRAVASADRPVVLAGDSAGANLALSVALAAVADPDLPDPVALVLLSPHLGFGADRAAAHHPRDDVDDMAARWLADAYRGDLPADTPDLSPLAAPATTLARLPPTLVQVGTADSSFDHGVTFSRLARSAGARVVLDVWHGMWHTWHYHRDLPEASRALAEAAAFVLATR